MTSQMCHAALPLGGEVAERMWVFFREQGPFYWEFNWTEPVSEENGEWEKKSTDFKLTIYKMHWGNKMI